MAYVQCHPHGLIIARPDKQQQVFLNRNEWSRLVTRSRAVTDFMAGSPIDRGTADGVSSGSDNSVWWHLSDGGGSEKTRIRLSLSVFHDAPYCNIRVYVGDTASKQGVTLNQSQWHTVRGVLGTDAETDTAREVFTEMLRECLLEGMGASCEGCARDWPSQHDHACLQEKNTLAVKVLAARPCVNPYEFQTRLAEKASTRKIALHRPADAYTVCNTMLRADVEAALLAEQGEDCL